MQTILNIFLQLFVNFIKKIIKIFLSLVIPIEFQSLVIPREFLSLVIPSGASVSGR